MDFYNLRGEDQDDLEWCIHPSNNVRRLPSDKECINEYYHKIYKDYRCNLARVIFGGNLIYFEPDFGALHSVLDEASARGQIEMTKLSLKLGTNPNVKNFIGFSPLHRASIHNRPGIVKILLEAGADSSIRTNNSWDCTPLDLAREHNHRDVIDVLTSQ